MFHLGKYNRQRGSVSLVISMLLLSSIGSVVVFTTKSVSLEQKILANDVRTKAAFSAAEAGTEFGIGYLQSNPTTILVDSNDDGSIDTYTSDATSSVALSDGNAYTLTFTNPVANDFDLIEINSVGTSADGTTTQTLTQLVKQTAVVQSTPPTPLTTKGSSSIGGNVTVSNTATDITVWSGGAASFSGSASTEISSGTGSDNSGNGADVVENDANLAGATGDQFFENFFGTSKADIKKRSNSVYSNTAETDMNSTLNGKTGEVIWIDQQSGDAIINENTVIGSPDNPVILIIDGHASINGGATIYGVVYVIGDWNNGGSGSSAVHGAVMVEGNYSSQGTPNMNYDETILNNTQSTLVTFSKIPGGWTDI